MIIPAERLFELANLCILPAWLLLMLAPQWHRTRSLVTSGNYSMAYAVLYLVILALNINIEQFSFSTLQNVQQLFADSNILLAGWIHYLAFDLLIGAWISKDASALKINHFALIPVLALTFYLGPVGYLTYRLIKYIKLLRADAV